MRRPREPVIHDDPPRQADLLVWQDTPRRRLMGHGVVTATRLVWMDEGEYGSPGEDGEYHTHDAAWWFQHRVQLWLPKADAPRIASARDNEWTAYPYRHVPGLSGQAAIVPIPLPMAARFIRGHQRAS